VPDTGSWIFCSRLRAWAVKKATPSFASPVVQKSNRVSNNPVRTAANTSRHTARPASLALPKTPSTASSWPMIIKSLSWPMLSTLLNTALSNPSPNRSPYSSRGPSCLLVCRSRRVWCPSPSMRGDCAIAASINPRSWERLWLARFCRVPSSPCDTHSLVRHRFTWPQQKMPDATARKDNIKNAFSLTPSADVHIKGKSIWLIDDISTTASTLDACARVLKQAGGQKSLRRRVRSKYLHALPRQPPKTSRSFHENTGSLNFLRVSLRHDTRERRGLLGKKLRHLSNQNESRKRQSNTNDGRGSHFFG
jgi:hypothetical protein